VSSDRRALRETIRTLLTQITTHAPSESINAHGHSTLTRDTGFEEQRKLLRKWGVLVPTTTPTPN
jgi:hypothetical protein